MSRVQQLREKYPRHPVKYAPLSDCPVCEGKGEFRNALNDTHVCACVCVGGPDQLRKVLVQTLQNTVHDLVKKVKEKKHGPVS